MNASTQPLHIGCPSVRISYLNARPILDVAGYDPEAIPTGEVIAVRIQLPHGVTDRYIVRDEDGTMRDINGDVVEGDLVSYRDVTIDELADWNDALKERCGTCDGSGFYKEWADSGSWCVAPAREDDPRARPCGHDGSRDAWRVA